MTTAPPILGPKRPAARRLTRDESHDRALAQHYVNQIRLDNRARATLLLSHFQDQVMAQAESWQMAARNIGSAYAKAGKRHLDALEKQEKIDEKTRALVIQACFSVLTVASAGALSWVSSGLQKGLELAERKVLIEAIEDAAQAGTGEVFSAMGPVVVPLLTSKNESVDINPQVFQNERENAVSAAKMRVLEHFGQIKLKWARAPLEKWNSYNEERQTKAHRDWLKGAATLAGKEKLPSTDVMADELERGMWAKGMPRLKSYHEFVARAQGIVQVDDYKSVGSAIEERLDKLSILKMAGVEIHRYQFAESEDKKLIAWAQGYKVKNLLSFEVAEIG